jgi:hypothetical protein
VSSPSNYSSINDIHHYPSRQFDPLSAIDRRLLPETWQYLDPKATHNDNGASGSTFAFFSDQMDAFSVQALSVYLLQYWKVPPPSPLHSCNFWIDFVQNWICFTISSFPHFLAHSHYMRL